VNPLGRQYEYEEQYYLSVDGSATIVIDASVPALVALRGLPIDPAPLVATDVNQLRRLFEAGGCRVVRIGQPWRRDGRRFVQVRLSVDDIRTLGACAPLGWSTYAFDRSATSIDYQQKIGPAAGGDPGTVSWRGAELVAVKLHLPSKVTFHNVRRLDNGETGDLERGNILTWEQRLSDRLAGKPIDIHVTMEAESILYRTLYLFGGAFAAALIVMVCVVWWVVRRGRSRARPVPSS
jgi:hypothetical protein